MILRGVGMGLEMEQVLRAKVKQLAAVQVCCGIFSHCVVASLGLCVLVLEYFFCKN